VARPLLPARHAHAEKAQPNRGKPGVAARRIRVMGIAAIDDDVTGRQQRHQLIDDRIDPGTRAHHHHHQPRRAQGPDQFREGGATQDIAPGPLPRQELLSPRPGAVVNGHPVAMVAEVEDQIAAHDRKADQT
jgi:hypothetical protein